MNQDCSWIVFINQEESAQQKSNPVFKNIKSIVNLIFFNFLPIFLLNFFY